MFKKPKNWDFDWLTDWPWPKKAKKPVTKREKPSNEELEEYAEWLIDEEHDSRHTGDRHPFVQRHLRNIGLLEED